ncbi:hypothetical protein [Phytopseudomonas daroniae]|uniref:hypothetical protein n=1 Tax=Pseudomonadaceae TaxID=135621 RepID=UPI001037A78C|nr:MULTISPECIES: hypothetical protein [Pseudomonas]
MGHSSYSALELDLSGSSKITSTSTVLNSAVTVATPLCRFFIRGRSSAHQHLLAYPELIRLYAKCMAENSKLQPWRAVYTTYIFPKGKYFLKGYFNGAENHGFAFVQTREEGRGVLPDSMVYPR